MRSTNVRQFGGIGVLLRSGFSLQKLRISGLPPRNLSESSKKFPRSSKIWNPCSERRQTSFICQLGQELTCEPTQVNYDAVNENLKKFWMSALRHCEQTTLEIFKKKFEFLWKPVSLSLRRGGSRFNVSYRLLPSVFFFLFVLNRFSEFEIQQ